MTLRLSWEYWGAPGGGAWAFVGSPRSLRGRNIDPGESNITRDTGYQKTYKNQCFFMVFAYYHSFKSGLLLHLRHQEGGSREPRRVLGWLYTCLRCSSRTGLGSSSSPRFVTGRLSPLLACPGGLLGLSWAFLRDL